MKPNNININDYDYELPEERIAKYPLVRRDSSRLLIYRNNTISESVFSEITDVIPDGSLLIFNDTKVIRARLLMQKPSGGRVEIFLLEPHEPAQYERILVSTGVCSWECMIGNAKRWKEGEVFAEFEYGNELYRLSAVRKEPANNIVRFTWQADITFGTLLEILGRIPIPPYLARESERIDEERYQTVYSRIEGSVAAPTAGLHFTNDIFERLKSKGVDTRAVTLHVGAGTFLPVKTDDASQHTMHTEHFEVAAETVADILEKIGNITVVGTTTVRTVESLCVLGYRILTSGNPSAERSVGQWEPYEMPEDISGKACIAALHGYMYSNKIPSIRSATSIMIVPGYRFRLVNAIITNFHQPKSTLLLLVSAFTGGNWRAIYDHALSNGFRFLSYGDSSILFKTDAI